MYRLVMASLTKKLNICWWYSSCSLWDIEDPFIVWYIFSWTTEVHEALKLQQKAISNTVWEKLRWREREGNTSALMKNTSFFPSLQPIYGIPFFSFHPLYQPQPLTNNQVSCCRSKYLAFTNIQSHLKHSYLTTRTLNPISPDTTRSDLQRQ